MKTRKNQIRNISFILLLCIVTASCTAKPQPSLPVSGQQVKINGTDIFYTVQGNGPLVVIMHEMGSSSAEWLHIQEKLSNHFTVLAYDRPGYGKSGVYTKERTGGIIAEELHLLLTHLSLNKPVVLIGDRMGGFYALTFAKIYPDKVQSLVLVNPITYHNDLFKERLEPVYYSNLIDRRPSIKLTRTLASIGLLRFMKPLPAKIENTRIRKAVLSYNSKPQTYDTMLDESGSAFKKTVKQYAKESLPAVPATVVHHNIESYQRYLRTLYLAYYEAREIEEIWQDTYAGIAALPRYTLVESNAAKEIHLNDPAAIIEAVRHTHTKNNK